MDRVDLSRFMWIYIEVEGVNGDHVVHVDMVCTRTCQLMNG